MTREEQRAKAAHEYIQSDSVAPGNEILAFGDFIEGAKWADNNPLNGWHPASKLPPKSKRIIVCYKDKNNYDLYTSQSSFLTKDNEYIGVPEYAQKTLMWSYPPEED